MAKICITMEQKIGGNISITSVYISFLDNTHPHSLKYHAFAKDSLTDLSVHSCPLSFKHFWVPTILSPSSISTCISHTFLQVILGSLSLPRISLQQWFLLLPSCSNKRQRTTPHSFHPLSTSLPHSTHEHDATSRCVAPWSKTPSISHRDDNHSFTTALSALLLPPPVFSQHSNRVVMISYRSDHVTPLLLTPAGSLSEKNKVLIISTKPYITCPLLHHSDFTL